MSSLLAGRQLDARPCILAHNEWLDAGSRRPSWSRRQALRRAGLAVECVCPPRANHNTHRPICTESARKLWRLWERGGKSSKATRLAQSRQSSSLSFHVFTNDHTSLGLALYRCRPGSPPCGGNNSAHSHSTHTHNNDNNKQAVRLLHPQSTPFRTPRRRYRPRDHQNGHVLASPAPATELLTPLDKGSGGNRRSVGAPLPPAVRRCCPVMRFVYRVRWFCVLGLISRRFFSLGTGADLHSARFLLARQIEKCRAKKPGPANN